MHKKLANLDVRRFQNVGCYHHVVALIKCKNFWVWKSALIMQILHDT